MEFDRLIETVQKHFYDRAFKGLRWTERVAFHRSHVTCGAKKEQVAQSVNELLAELHTSHTGVYTSKDQEYWALHGIFSGSMNSYAIPQIGIWASKAGGYWYVQDVLTGSSGDKAGFMLGDRLDRINLEPYEPLGFINDSVHVVTVTRTPGVSIRIYVKPEIISFPKAFLRATKQSVRIIHSGGRRIGYFHLWCGTHKAFKSSFEAALRSFSSNTDALIIDLRDGFGGAYPEYFDYLRKAPEIRRLPKVFLINRGVRSGKEWLSAVVKRDQLGTLIGTKTAGAFIGGSPFDIMNGRYLLFLATEEFFPPGIAPIEGIGVSPDIEVPSCTQYCENRDPQLDFALGYLTALRRH